MRPLYLCSALGSLFWLLVGVVDTVVPCSHYDLTNEEMRLITGGVCWWQDEDQCDPAFDYCALSDCDPTNTFCAKDPLTGLYDLPNYWSYTFPTAFGLTEEGFVDGVDCWVLWDCNPFCQFVFNDFRCVRGQNLIDTIQQASQSASGDLCGEA